MVFRFKFPNLHISTKLWLLNLMTWVAFFLIVGVLVSSFAIVRNQLTAVANRDMSRVIVNSQTTRKLSKVFADIDLLSRNFYGRKDYLASEGGRLVTAVKKISESTLDPDLQKILLAMSDTFDSFLSRCVRVNQTLHAMESIRGDIHDELTELENLVAKLLVYHTLEGEDVSFLEQLLTLLVGFRESLLQIQIQEAEHGYEHYFSPLEGERSILISIIDDLLLRLSTITTSIPHVSGHGEKIVTHVKNYRGVVFTFYDEMEGLGLRLADLNKHSALSMSLIESIDDKISRATTSTIQSIEKIMVSFGTVAVSLSVIVIIAIGIAGAYLIRSNITNPMMALLKGLESFGHGDLDTQIELNRKDEWGTIEAAFNDMAAELLKSYTALQKAHDELEHLVDARTADLATTTEQLKRELIVRERTEETLRESEERLSVTLKSIGDAVIATETEGKVILMNPVAEQLTGWSNHAAKGQDSEAVFNIVDEQTGARVDSPIARILRDGVVGPANQTILIDRDGTRRPIDDTGAPIRDDKGNLIGVVLIFRDVTEMRKTQKALKEYSKQLEEMVERRTRALKNAQEELIRKERLAVLGQLTATVAHEIRNPLGTIQTSVFSIGDAIARKEMKRVDRALSLATRNIRRCDAIITELLDFTSRKELKKAPFEIDAWLKDVLDEQKLPQEIDYKPEMNSGIQILFDSEYLRRAVINVVTNAVQALKEEGSPNKELKVTTAVAGNRLEIRIVDTGPGIPGDIREKIFEPLFSTKGFGVGLGLSIVTDIMAEHGGGVEIESERGKGTTVTMWLPLN